MKKGTIQLINDKYTVTCIQKRGFWGYIRFIKVYDVTPTQQEFCNTLLGKEIEFTIENNLAILNI